MILKAQTKILFSPSAKTSLLFDPQTSGGLLASIPEKEVTTVVAGLKKSGFCSSIIGRVDKGEPFITISN